MTPAARRILIATDAWHPQVNGVVRTLTTTVGLLTDWGHTVGVVSPADFHRLPNPVYPEIELAVVARHALRRRVAAFRPDHLHVATEGPVGQLVRRDALRHGLRFTTAYHTRFPEYLEALVGVPARVGYAALRRFHNRASAMMVATPSLERELVARGFTVPIRRWSRGTDPHRFHAGPRTPHPALVTLPRPVMLYVGRVSAEKNLEAFLRLALPGTQVVVGDGPARARLEAEFPRAKFLGRLTGEPLASAYAGADVFVFPSLTDTFGLVVIEALASGLPVAAYPVTGPTDIVTRPELGCLSDDLGSAIASALATGDRAACAEEGRRYSWPAATAQFLSNLVSV